MCGERPLWCKRQGKINLQPTMGLRIQRRFKLLPGVHVNLSKSGLSLSLGPTGLKTTIGNKGVRTSVDIPGTGIRYETAWNNSSVRPSAMGDFQGQAGPTPSNNQITGNPMRVMRNSSNPVFDECKKKRLYLMIFRITYILASLAAIVFVFTNLGMDPEQAFFPLMAVIVCFVCLLTFDVYVSLMVKQKENEELRRQRNSIAQAREIEQQRTNRIRQEQHRIWQEQERSREEQRIKAINDAEEAAVDAWTKRCDEAGGFIVIESTFPCKRGEGVLYTEHGVSLKETRKVRVQGGRSVDQWTTLDTGTLHVTNQRLVFIGDNGTRTVAVKDIVSQKIYLDAFDITSSKRTKPMSFSSSSPLFVLALLHLVG